MCDGEYDVQKCDGSNGLVLDWFFGVDDAFLVEDAVATVGAFDCIIGFELRFLPAF